MSHSIVPNEKEGCERPSARWQMSNTFGGRTQRGDSEDTQTTLHDVREIV